MSIDVFGGTVFIPRQLIHVLSVAFILSMGVLGILPNLRAGNRRRAMAAGLFTAVLLASILVTQWLPFTLKPWSLLVLMFGASVYFGVYGWIKLRREPVVTLAFKYSLAGLSGSLLLLVVMLLLPRQFALILTVTSFALFAVVGAGGAWMVKNHPARLTDGLWTASLSFYFSALQLLLGCLTAHVYASRGWLSF